MVNQLWFYTVLDDLATLLTNNWGGASGAVPNIQILWDEKLLTYHDTDSYILLSSEVELTRIFSHREGVGANEYRWYHTVPVDIDIRVYKTKVADLKSRFQEVYNRVEQILKDNIRLVVSGNIYVRIKPVSATPDFTRRQTLRVVRHIEVDKVE